MTHNTLHKSKKDKLRQYATVQTALTKSRLETAFFLLKSVHRFQQELMIVTEAGCKTNKINIATRDYSENFGYVCFNTII